MAAQHAFGSGRVWSGDRAFAEGQDTLPAVLFLPGGFEKRFWK